MARQRALLTAFSLWLFGLAVLPACGIEQPTELRPIKIAMIGDSTMASYAKPPEDRSSLTGWGQVFELFFNDRVKVSNHAQSGRSSKSFLREGRWEPVLREKPDFIFIQFGHNDQPGKGDRETDPNGDFQDNLRKFIDEARAAGVEPVLVTPVARRIFDNGKATTTLTPYADAMKKVAAEKKVPLVDLHAASFDLFNELGDAGSADLSASASDRTHFSRKGALEIAKLVAHRLPQDVPALHGYLRHRPEQAGVFAEPLLEKLDLFESGKDDDALLEPICMASIIRLSEKPAGDKNRIVFANPHNLARTDGNEADGKSRDRKNLSIKLSEDDGLTWPISKVLEPGMSVYSDLAVLPEGTILCFYERGRDAGSEPKKPASYTFLTLARFNLNWLKTGKEPQTK